MIHLMEHRWTVLRQDVYPLEMSLVPNDDLAGVAALAEPQRRQLYDVVAGADDAVSREQAAQLTGVPVHTAKFHLDRLVDEGLLEVEYRRLTGRTGPGSGRPAKLYRRADRELSVSLPQRQYDLLSRILASAVAAATTSGEPVGDVAAAVARAEGTRFGSEHRTRTRSELRRLADALAAGGYEPRVLDRTLELRNCPFHRVAQEQTTLVCGLNLEYVDGVREGLACRGVETALDPAPGRCCVRAADTGRSTGSA
jgi:predicted ArsR family transcriptional regulator